MPSNMRPWIIGIGFLVIIDIVFFYALPSVPITDYTIFIAFNIMLVGSLYLSFDSHKADRFKFLIAFTSMVLAWTLAYGVSTPSLAAHTALAIVIGGAVWGLSLLPKLHEYLYVVESQEEQIRKKNSVAILSMDIALVAAVLLALFVPPFSTHRVELDPTWTLATLLTPYQIALWVVAGLILVFWSFGGLSKLAITIFILVTVICSFVLYQRSRPVPQQVSLNVLLEHIQDGEVEELVIKRGSIQAILNNEESIKTEITSNIGALEILREMGVEDQQLNSVNITMVNDGFLGFTRDLAPLAVTVILLAIFMVVMVMLIRSLNLQNSNVPGFGGLQLSDDNVIEAEWPEETFEDVGGAEKAREAINDIVVYLKDPRPFVAVGARLSSGILFEGPPGTGKTLLARALAGEFNQHFLEELDATLTHTVDADTLAKIKQLARFEDATAFKKRLDAILQEKVAPDDIEMVRGKLSKVSRVSFFYVSGSEFIEMFVGVGAARIRDLFKKARKNAPSIIFIDEIDAVGLRREAAARSNSEDHKTINQLLYEMDGFKRSPKGKPVIVIGATNRVDVLDEALIRTGRFDRRVLVDLPDFIARKEIMSIHLHGARSLSSGAFTRGNSSEQEDKKTAEKGKPLADDVKVDEIAQFTLGMSGAELATAVNEAAFKAGKEKRDKIPQDFILEAVKEINKMMLHETRLEVNNRFSTGPVVGQDAAMRRLALAISYHFSDIRALYDSKKLHVGKPNVFLFGPPGTGKTLMVETLAARAKIPVAFFDAAELVRDVHVRSAFRRLYDAARGDIRHASTGIMCIYGLESVLHANSNFIQEELARIVHDATFDLAEDGNYLHGRRASLSTNRILFILEATLPVPKRSFQDRLNALNQAGNFPDVRASHHVFLTDLGFSMRLLDKFPLMIQTRPLGVHDLKLILKRGEDSLLAQAKRRFHERGIELDFQRRALALIAYEAHRRGDGARWLPRLLYDILEDPVYDHTSDAKVFIGVAAVCQKIGSGNVPPSSANGSLTSHPITDTL